MDIQELKFKICEENKIENILEGLGCKYIKSHDKYFTCSNPDGDNKSALQVYKNNMMIISYTRNIDSKYDAEYPDLIDYVNFYRKDKYFTENLKWICEVCGYDYYKSISTQNKPAPLLWLEQIKKMKSNLEEDDIEDLKPIDENILKYYLTICNDMWYNDGVKYSMQSEFEIGIDLKTQSITIPIRDELGTLVGVKARKLYDEENKYFALECFAKTQVLYGLYKSMAYIKNKKQVIVVESEKSVLKLWGMGVRNCVASLGYKLSKTQIKKLTMLDCEIVLAFDKDVLVNDLEYIRSLKNKFVNGVNVKIIVDRSNLMEEKESPADKESEVFYELLKGRVDFAEL